MKKAIAAAVLLVSSAVFIAGCDNQKSVDSTEATPAWTIENKQALNDGGAAYNRDDYATALKVWTPLAKQGYAEAQYNLGLLYAEGQGVQQNYTEAVKWYRLAAKKGDASAQFALGRSFEFGDGVVQNYTSAHMWYNISASHSVGVQKQKSSDALYLLAAKMTPDQIERSQQKAESCVRTKYLLCNDLGLGGV